MGKRQVGELQPSELVVTLIISELVAIPIQNNSTSLLQGILPIICLVALEIMMARVILYHPRMRNLTLGKPSILIDKGKINQAEMKRLRFSIDDLSKEIRQKGFLGLDEVYYAVLETSGKMSVFPKPEDKPATLSTLKAPYSDPGIPTELISNGRLLSENIKKAKLTESWIHKKLKENYISKISDVFYMTVNKKNTVIVIKKDVSANEVG